MAWKRVYLSLYIMAAALGLPARAEQAETRPEPAAPATAQASAAQAPAKPAKAKAKATLPAAPSGKEASDQGESITFQEIEFGKTLIIEGKVEKPQVQFTLLKEPPPEKDLKFETSFLQNILKQERENTFKPGERHGRE